MCADFFFKDVITTPTNKKNVYLSVSFVRRSTAKCDPPPPPVCWIYLPLVAGLEFCGWHPRSLEMVMIDVALHNEEVGAFFSESVNGSPKLTVDSDMHNILHI